MSLLAAVGMNVSIYNHQLCTVPPDLWDYCRPAISDWKNEYSPDCQGCAVKARCGGGLHLECRSAQESRYPAGRLVSRQPHSAGVRGGAGSAAKTLSLSAVGWRARICPTRELGVVDRSEWERRIGTLLDER